MTTKQINKVRDIIFYPTDLIGTTLSKDVILSIANRNLNLIKYTNTYLNEYRYPSHEYICNSFRSIGNCWRGVISYINGNTDWDSCYGVNNPYLMGTAHIK